MTKKKMITIVSILTAAIIITCFVAFTVHKQKMQKLQIAIQNFGIYETDDITISNYDRYGLWGDQSLKLSTTKDFENFVDENIIVPVTIRDESDLQQKTDVGFSMHVIDFEYTNGNQKIYGKFFVQSNSEIYNVLLIIHG